MDGLDDSVKKSVVSCGVPDARPKNAMNNRNLTDKTLLAPNNKTPERIEAGSLSTQIQGSIPPNASTVTDVSLNETIELDSLSNNRQRKCLKTPRMCK